MTVQPTRDQLRALANAATPGPWEAGEPRGWGDNDDEPQSDIDTPAGVLTWDDHGGEVFKPADAEFIAAARTAIPQLLDQLDRAEARIAEEKRLRMEATAAATAAEARIKRLENRAASETARADEWRRKHRVMAGKRDAARRAWFEEAKARREAETRTKAVRDVLDNIDTSNDPALHDGFADVRRALDGDA